MGIYQDTEDKWYGFLDWLDEKGVHMYGVVDGVEKAGVPSFPLAVLLLLIIVAGLGLFMMSVMQPQYTLTVIVNDEISGNAISGAEVGITYTFNEETKTDTRSTSSDGKAEFLVPKDADVSIKVTKTDYGERIQDRPDGLIKGDYEYECKDKGVTESYKTKLRKERKQENYMVQVGDDGEVVEFFKGVFTEKETGIERKVIAKKDSVVVRGKAQVRYRDSKGRFIKKV